ncbi:MAG TPA: hypothetical protein VFH73_10900 [Polyangia bacterium]|jgi:hypothetical protein|nr:hypothetical protein [Polyangia bacterium]
MNRSSAPFTSTTTFLCLLPLAMAGACGIAPGEESQPETEAQAEGSAAGLRVNRAPAFVDVQEVLGSEDDQNRWFELTGALRHDFDDICGDTFCEGDFTNLESMSFRCSASTRTGQIKTCLWLFAGSYESVTASSGNIRPVAKFFSCAIPVTGTPRALLDALLAPQGRGPLWRPLPGTTSSIYDHLGDCL